MGIIIFLFILVIVAVFAFFVIKSSTNSYKKLGFGKYIITSQGIYYKAKNHEEFYDFNEINNIYISESKISGIFYFLNTPGSAWNLPFSNQPLNFKLNSNVYIQMLIPSIKFKDTINIFRSTPSLEGKLK